MSGFSALIAARKSKTCKGVAAVREAEWELLHLHKTCRKKVSAQAELEEVVCSGRSDVRAQIGKGFAFRQSWQQSESSILTWFLDLSLGILIAGRMSLCAHVLVSSL
jgi:hypothetical protein